MRRLAVLVAAGLLAASCGGDSDGASVTGTVIASPQAPPVRELPAGATLIVTLQDVSLADAPAAVIATQTIDLTGAQFPVAYELAYSLGDIADSNTYSVAARVEAGGDLLLVSDTMTPVITRGAPTSGVVVSLVYLADN